MIEAFQRFDQLSDCIIHLAGVSRVLFEGPISQWIVVIGLKFILVEPRLRCFDGNMHGRKWHIAEPWLCFGFDPLAGFAHNQIGNMTWFLN